MQMKAWILLTMALTTLITTHAKGYIISGSEAQALSVAVVRFQADFKTHYLKPRLKNYDVDIEHSKSSRSLIIIHFVPHPDSVTSHRGGGNSYGPDVDYYIHIGDFKVIKRQLSR